MVLTVAVEAERSMKHDQPILAHKAPGSLARSYRASAVLIGQQRPCRAAPLPRKGAQTTTGWPREPARNGGPGQGALAGLHPCPLGFTGQ